VPTKQVDRDQSQQLAELDERVRSFEDAVSAQAASNARGFTHPYFGLLNMRDGVRLAAVHTRHHERALRRSLAHSAGK